MIDQSISLEKQQPKTRRFNRLWIAAGLAGIASSAAVAVATVSLTVDSDLRAKVFFSEPVQQVFASEIDLLSTGLANGGEEVTARRAKSDADRASRADAGEPRLMPTSYTGGLKPLTAGQREVVQYISKKYRVSPEAIENLVRLAWKVGKEEGVEPTLILAISGVESSYNPFAASSVGAKGLMQVMAHIHKDKFEKLSPGNWSPLNPELNMRVGAQIIEEYTRRTGSVHAGLRWYVGAAIHGNDGGYPNKVLGLKSKIDDAYRKGRVVAEQLDGSTRQISALDTKAVQG